MSVHTSMWRVPPQLNTSLFPDMSLCAACSPFSIPPSSHKPDYIFCHSNCTTCWNTSPHHFRCLSLQHYAVWYLLQYKYIASDWVSLLSGSELVSRELSSGVLSSKYLVTMNWNSRQPGSTLPGKVAFTQFPEWNPACRWYLTPAMEKPPSLAARKELLHRNPASMVAHTGAPKPCQQHRVTSTPHIHRWTSTPKVLGGCGRKEYCS